ncbi:hypothetical protein Fot_32272 [Forsythia ovata]|uniref:Uncharacterized protein n=1 Tax=Forsythia ovata TaxID=205694 RepID=A0ABD1T7Q9_9LAMI
MATQQYTTCAEALRRAYAIFNSLGLEKKPLHIADSSEKKKWSRRLWVPRTLTSSENKIFRLKLDLTEEAKRQAEYEALRAQSMQKVCNNARRRAELKLKVCEYMAYANPKELAEAMAELSKANESLARLEAHTCADPKGVTGP